MASLKPCTLFLLFSLFFVYYASTIILATEGKDPELEQCVQKCRHQQGITEPQRQYCEERCRDYYEKKHGGGGMWNPQREEGGEGEERGQGQQEDENPYLFEDRHFTTPVRSEHGRYRVLQNFLERSKLFAGIMNYRLEIADCEPQTFVVPNHLDAEAIVFIAQGKGTVSLVHPKRRESFNVKAGDVLSIPAGTTVYVINSHNNEKLVAVKLLQPVNTPGRFEEFIGAGGQNPESFFRTFSRELVEAVFNTRKVDQLFNQDKGVIIKASEEQIREMSQHQEGGIWPFGESKGTINIFEKRPVQSNEYGELREVTPDECRHLRDFNVAVSFANITKGAMQTAHYNSKSTKITLVLNGEGYLEMACPHLSEEQGGSQGPTYKKVNARLKRGTVVVVPAGHPLILAASKNQNLQLVCFELNAGDNERIPLAGKNNIWSQLERQAMELAFGTSAEQVKEILRSQSNEWFLKGPSQLPQQQQGRDRDYLLMKV